MREELPPPSPVPPGEQGRAECGSTSPLRRLAARSEAILWIVAAVALGAAGLGYADGALFQLRNANTDFAQSPLEAGDAPEAAPEVVEPLDAFAVAGAQLSPRSLPASGTAIARIAVPRLDLDVVVAEGDEPRTLRRAVGRLPASALPGEPDNIVLAAHRDTFFRPLEGIALGDLVTLESSAGLHSYLVEWTAVVEPDHVSVAAATGYPALTLITCYPFRYVGNAPQRFVVRARRVDEAAVTLDSTAPARAPAPPSGAFSG